MIFQEGKLKSKVEILIDLSRNNLKLIAAGSISKSVIEEESIGECLRSSQIFNAIPSPNFSALWNSATPSVFSHLCPLPSSGHSYWSYRAQTVLAADLVGFPRSLTQEGWVRLGRNLPMSLNPFPNALSSLASCFYAITDLEMLPYSFEKFRARSYNVVVFKSPPIS